MRFSSSIKLVMSKLKSFPGLAIVLIPSNTWLPGYQKLCSVDDIVEWVRLEMIFWGWKKSPSILRQRLKFGPEIRRVNVQ